MTEPVTFVEPLAHRLSQLTFDSQRRWGQMTAPEMVCHLSDSFRAMLGERVVAQSFNWSPIRRRFALFVALKTPMPWPRGLATLPEVNPHRGGTRPADFEHDRTELLTLLHRFVAPGARYAAHPMFGAMTRSEWLIWTFRHVDHHLRQFSL